jgi:hypothetical protein
MPRATPLRGQKCGADGRSTFRWIGPLIVTENRKANVRLALF